MCTVPPNTIAILKVAWWWSSQICSACSLVKREGFWYGRGGVDVMGGGGSCVDRVKLNSALAAARNAGHRSKCANVENLPNGWVFKRCLVESHGSVRDWLI
ncbi:hypothetical protein PF005_g1173 [Phytophthora fragariae]|uniref:Pectate lyase n=1 Tax=Phytophthora fragariae TaxID=53985 RepID=A0A6A3TBF3_9STRA|nr:hypothetical protein PF003_g329 [Phytophthora fragariae]KAE8949512.1 hypothetical protein PF009_g940 [Phytophthora fragariae]KAE9133176.1 hypothetical protein PF007_g3448 [Phytophthora fragariae]KAE9153038.1 hypothetical protein PF006_g2796 [Phytophthora fragariae]KAE9236180.1 hypothetical protein PF005_g1173 [Phytophthora fragariae]